VGTRSAPRGNPAEVRWATLGVCPSYAIYDP
jgi:hypothetical protein